VEDRREHPALRRLTRVAEREEHLDEVRELRHHLVVHHHQPLHPQLEAVALRRLPRPLHEPDVRVLPNARRTISSSRAAASVERSWRFVSLESTGPQIGRHVGRRALPQEPEQVSVAIEKPIPSATPLAVVHVLSR